MSELLSAPAAERLAAALFHFLWQGTFLCLLYPLAVNLNLLRTPQARYRFGLSVFFLMAVCPVVTFWQVEPVSNPQAFTVAPAVEIEIANRPLSNIQHALFGSDWISPQGFLTCWMIGVVCLSLRLAGGYRQLRRWRSETIDLQPQLQSQIVSFCRRMGLRTVPKVNLSVHVTEAMAFGFWKPVILLPVSWASELPVSTLEAIIAHELAHIRRFDLWINLGQRFVETMLFYHPAVWWLSNRIREEREFCCDELAARTTGECLGYALALEGVARYLAGSHTLLGTSFLGDGKMKLLKRVRHVLGQSSSTKRKLWWPAGMLALMLPIGIYGTSLTAQDAPRERDRPRTEREEGRRDGDRERPRDGDRPRGERDRPPRDGDRPPRDGDRPRPPRDGDRPPQGDRPRGERDLYREIELLREEIRQLREQIRRQGPPPRGGFGPPRDGFRPPFARGPRGPLGPPRDGDGPPRDGEGPPRDGFGPPREGFRPPRDGEGPPRNGFRPPRDGQGPPREGDRPRGEGDRPLRPRLEDGPPREGERPPGERPPRDGDRPRGEGDRPRPPRDGERPPRDGDRPRPPREGERPPGDRPPREGDRPRREGERPRPPREGERPPREGDRPPGDRPPREGDRPRGEGDRPRPPREGERPPREGDRPREERPDRPERPEPEVPAE